MRVYQPFKIAGENNITIHSPASIGPGSTIYTTGAKLIIGSHFVAGPNLTIITGDHKYMHLVDTLILFLAKKKSRVYMIKM